MTFDADQPLNCSIRDAVPADEPELRDLFRIVVRAMDTLPSEAKDSVYLKYITGNALKTRIKNKKNMTLIARDDDQNGRLIGSVFAEPFSRQQMKEFGDRDPANVLWLSWIGIHPDYRGREAWNSGHRLSDVFLGALQSRIEPNQERLEATTQETNIAARKMFERNDFVQAGTVIDKENGLRGIRYQYYPSRKGLN